MTKMAFDQGERTYYVSDERLRAFRALPIADRLRWVEELAAFLRLAKASQPGVGDNSPKPTSVERNVT